MEIDIYQVDAFAEVEGGGNPAGVVPNARGLSDNDMQKIAQEMGLSETAFVFDRDNANGYDFEVRFFKPTEEVDLCGHATIATFHLLSELGIIEKNKKELIQKTKAGLLAIRLNQDGILMRQASPVNVNKSIDFERLYQAMAIEKETVGLSGIMINPEIWSTGLADVIMPIRNVELLKMINPKMDELSKISNELGVTGVHAFTIDENDQVWCRNFAPACGIDEESATGTSNGALGAFLHLKVNENIERNTFTAYQGDWMSKPSRIKVMTIQGETLEVWVGGKAITIAKGLITLPEIELKLYK